MYQLFFSTVFRLKNNKILLLAVSIAALFLVYKVNNFFVKQETKKEIAVEKIKEDNKQFNKTIKQIEKENTFDKEYITFKNKQINANTSAIDDNCYKCINDKINGTINDFNAFFKDKQWNIYYLLY